MPIAEYPRHSDLQEKFMSLEDFFSFYETAGGIEGRVKRLCHQNQVLHFN